LRIEDFKELNKEKSAITTATRGTINPTHLGGYLEAKT
jgi:hypothetical protein